MIILGVNSAYHESAAVLLVGGQLVAAAEEERFNRVKHGKRANPSNADELPWSAIDFCLQRADLQYADVTAIGYSFDPWARRRIRWDDARPAPQGEFGTPEGEDAFFHALLGARRQLLERMPGAQFHFFSHHVCHAASSFYTCRYEDAAILVVDGIGEFASAWAGYGSGNSIRKLFEVEYPHSLGFLWEKTCEFLGFDRYDGPGKVMALGAASRPISSRSGVDYRERFASFVRTRPAGLFEVDAEVLRYRALGFDGLETVLGPREKVIATEVERAALAAGLQETTESVLLHMASELWCNLNSSRGHKAEVLCMAGGVALNCVANAKIISRSPWKKLWIQPAAHDAGTALGAALLIWHEVIGRAERVPFDHVFWGPDYTEAEYRSALSAFGLRCSSRQDLPRQVARMIAGGKVVGWFQGRMEFGPRALGNRSIVADPRHPGIRSTLNASIKEREAFRPFAPTVLAEEVHHYFGTVEGSDGNLLAPLEYMLLALPARGNAHASLAGVTHVNEVSGEASSRVHTLVAGRNPLYEELLAACHEELRVPAILNTSFNVQEPIVCAPLQACRTFAQSGMDSLVLGPYIVEKG